MCREKLEIAFYLEDRWQQQQKKLPINNMEKKIRLTIRA